MFRLNADQVAVSVDAGHSTDDLAGPIAISFIDEQRVFGVEPICRLLPIAP
jgi:hypothetical protein